MAGCLLYVDPVNEAPEVLRITGPQTMVRGQEATFTATVHDANQNPETVPLAWGVVARDCPADLDGALSVSELMPPSGATLRWRAPSLGTFCVFAIATDDRGARTYSRHALAFVVVENQKPVANIELTGKPPMGPDGRYQLHGAFTASGAKSEDPERDAIKTYSWRPLRPAGLVRRTTMCPANDFCFDAAVPGEYELELVVEDDVGTASEPVRLSLTVADDQPPCIDVRPPPITIHRSSEDLVTLSLERVDDDGDPYKGPPQPINQQYVTWKFRKVHQGTTVEFDRFTEVRERHITIPPGTYRFPDVVQVRVQVTDRVARSFSACEAADVASCQLDARPNCYQWRTWTIEYR